MRKLIVAALIALCASTTASEARRYHRSHHHHAHRHQDHRVHADLGARRQRNDAGGLFGFMGGSSLVAQARSQVGNGAVYGRATLWCARFVNSMLSAVGLRGTGSDLAFSFARYGHRVSGPRPGAIAVMARRGGGHVGIVSGVSSNGNPILISGNNRGRVRETEYPRTRIALYVMPN